MPSSHDLGKVSVSNIKLNEMVYSGSIILDVLFIYSLIISSSAHALLFFNSMIHFINSLSVIREFKISSSSSM